MFQFIDITVPTLDLHSRAYTRLLSQFRNSQVLVDVLGVIVQEIKVLSDAIRGTVEGFIPATAVGAQQDVIGRILGVDRNSGYRFEEIPRITQDSVVRETEAGEIRFLDTGVLPSLYQLSNYEYKAALAGKAFRNFCQHGSIPEIQEYFQIVFGLEVIPSITGPSSVTLTVPADTDDALITILPRVKATNVTENAFYAPYPATIDITVVKGE